MECGSNAKGGRTCLMASEVPLICGMVVEVMTVGACEGKEEHTVSEAIVQNGYPCSHLHPSSFPHFTQSDFPFTVPHCRYLYYHTIPYIKGTSEAIRRVLSPLGIRTTFRPANTLQQLLVRPKDPVPQQERPGVVYHNYLLTNS